MTLKMMWRMILFTWMSFIFLSTLSSQTITAVKIPTAIAGSGGAGTVGYPYAVFVNISGWTAAASSQAYVKIYYSTNNEFMWSATGVWSSTTTYSSSNQPVVNIDAAGNWTGWVYMKHNDAVTGPKLRAAKVGATSTNLTSGSLTFNVLNTTPAGNGGWVVRNTSPAVNKPIFAYSGGNIVGSYRTEDNGIAEGYSYGAGGFKIAVPAGFIDSLVAVNDDGSHYQTFIGSWSVNAGAETDVSVGGGQIGVGSAFITPSQLQGGISGNLTVHVVGAASETLHVAQIIPPASWTWSYQTGDLSLSGAGSPTASISGDTVIVSGLTLSGTDTLHVQFNNIIPADSTAVFNFTVRTGVTADSIFTIGTPPAVTVLGSPSPISDVKQNDANGIAIRLGRLITVRGIVTVANQFGSPSYIQDNTGGMSVFDHTFSESVSIGDEVIVTGTVSQFNGLNQVSPVTSFSIVSSGNAVTPVEATATQLNSDGAGGIENYEGSLVRLNDVTVSLISGGSVGTWAYQNYRLTGTSGTDTVEIRIDDSTNIINTVAPAGAFDVIGVLSQFKSSSPFIGGYQLMPRSTADVISQGPLFAVLPSESNLAPTSLTISWQTINPGTTALRYGKTTGYELGVVNLHQDSVSTGHSLDLTGLDVATIYNVQAFSSSGTDTSFAPNLIVSTTSAPPTTGQINVYFNKSVDTTVSEGIPALGNYDLVTKFVQHINAARHSIDLALYSFSGSTGSFIAAALLNAKARGVSIRAIGEYDNRNSTAWNTLIGNGIPVIFDAYGSNDGTGLHHNKFIIFDARGGAPDSVWLWTGSWNLTDPGTLNDRQNSIEFQDVAIAGAYTVEFNEEWGSSTDTPNPATSRFGARKTDNTPHKFIVGTSPVEVYFSPSDRTTSHIAATLHRAQSSVNIGMYNFTRLDLADTVIALKQRGRTVRIVTDDTSAADVTGNQSSFLRSNGVDLLLKGFTDGLFHHKYAIVDGTVSSGPRWVITGSHNWTNSAENSNNENTVIVQDNRIANLYIQEFSARYNEAGGSNPIVTGVTEIRHTLPTHYELTQNYPNPFNPATSFDVQIMKGGVVTLKIYNVLGQEVATLISGTKAPGVYHVTWNASTFSSGVYFYRLQAGTFVDVKKMLLVR